MNFKNLAFTKELTNTLTITCLHVMKTTFITLLLKELKKSTDAI